MKLLLAILSAACAFGQAAPPLDLPSPIIGIGPTWQRGSANPYALDVNIALRAGQSRFYSYSTVSTPIVKPIPGAPPVVSSMTTGGAYVAFQSPGGTVSVIFIAQAGFSAVQVGSTVAPAFNGSIGVPIRISKAHSLYLMPFARAINASTSATSGALATAVLQPGVQLLYGFGSK